VGLVRVDGTTKPAYTALRELIRGEWWLAPTTLRTDAAGAIRVRGFLGDYAVSAAGGSAPFAITPGASRATLRLARLTP
jgi:hypothetical protein